MADIHSRKVWSLSTGKIIDEGIIDDIADYRLHRALKEPDDIRVELVLKGALKLFERKGPDIVEIYSQPRVCQEVDGRDFLGERLRPGYSLDLTTKDPKTGLPWDLSSPTVQARVKELIKKTKPYCVIGSPPCTPFSPLQGLNNHRRDPKVVEREIQMGKKHMRFCLEIYAMQLAAHRHFVHEHPERSRAWLMPEMQQFLLRPEVGSVVMHMCAFGMTAKDEHGRAPVLKPTRIMSSSEEILKRIDRRCSNGYAGHGHRHVQLISGRARFAQVYPRKFAIALCQGIAAQRKLDNLGMKARALMSVDEMKKVASTSENEDPSEALHEPGCEGMEAYDDITGQELDPRLMMSARRDEIKYFRDMGVYEKVSVQESYDATG